MPKYSSLQQVQKSILNNETNCEKLVDFYLKNIEAKNQEINAFVEVYAEKAKEQAKIIDKKIQSNSAGKLAGMVIGIKDNICYKNHKVTASSKILEGFESLFSATVVENLIKEDAIIIGRLNCDEFAMGSANETSYYGPVKNPLDTTKVPGGSSGGSAAAVAADMCLASLGSDTGGSIRQPASFCGIYGFKPTYGRVSRNGLIAFASSLDQIGPFANSIEDIALITEVISGKDIADASSSNKEVPSLKLEKNTGKKKIAYLKQYVESEGLNPEIKTKVLDTIDKLKKEGHTVEAVEFPYLDYMVPSYYVISTAEASSNLARFDGVHFGYRSEKGTDLESIYKNTRTEGFGTEVKRRILLGTFVLSSGYYDAYYTKAQKARRLIAEKTTQIFNDFDFILIPTTPHTAFEIGKERTDPTALYLEDIFTVHANLSGNPAISIPTGKHSNGLPFGIQLMADKFKEKELLNFSKYLAESL